MADDYDLHLKGLDDFDRTIPLHRIAKTPAITFNMLLAHLSACRILQTPRSPRSSYRWAVDITDPAVARDFSFQQGLMFIGPSAVIAQFSNNHSIPSGSLFIVLTERDEVPEGLPIRSLVIKQEHEYQHYVKRIQGLFLAMWIWETELSHIAFGGTERGKRGKLQEILDMECPFAPEFLCITDTGFNLVAWSKSVEPPTPPMRALVENGCYSLDAIDYLRKRVLARKGPANASIVCEPDGECPYYSIHRPIIIEGAYVFHLTMVVRNESDLASRKDIFSVLAAHVAAICTEFWKSHIEVESSCHKILIRMIEKRDMAPEYISTQLAATVIPQTNFFRLIRYRIGPHLSLEQTREASIAVKGLIPDHCYPFMYHDDLLVLLCSPTNNLAGISINKLIRQTNDIMFDTYGLCCALSQPFRRIDDIARAYWQTIEALEHEKLLRTAYPLGYDGKGSFPIIPFEHVLQFMLIGGKVDSQTLKEAFSNSIVKVISKEDAEQGGDFTKLLWEFLCAQGNASEVAKEFNMHRNTVVYHIKKFEKRFDVNLDLPMVRHRLYLDFLNHFANEK